MPTYTFMNKETGENFEEFFLSYSDKDKYLKKNKHIEQTLVTPVPLADPTRLGIGIGKPSGEFRDRLKDMKKHYPRNKINTW